MYGDPGEIRAVARRLRALADRTRAEQSAVLRGRDVAWSSTAADAFRADLVERAGQVARCADELEQAAAAVEAHADEVEQRIEAIRAAEAWARREIGELRDTAASVAERVVDGVRDLASDAVDLLRRVPDELPPAGSVEWLDVSSRLRGGR